MRARRRDVLALAALTCAGLTLCLPLILRGYLHASDAATHMLWAQQVLRGFDSGLWYPRWLPDVNVGGGGASLIFYPPFIFYTYALIHLALDSVPAIVSVSAGLALVLSGLSLYALARTRMGRAASVAAAVAYMGLPYHLLDLYHRSAMAEHWAFVWAPLTFLFLDRVERDGGKSGVPIAMLAASVAALIVTHALVALLTLSFLGVYLLVVSWRARSARVLAAGGGGLALGLALAAVYLVPAAWEQRNMYMDREWAGGLYARNFLFSPDPIEPATGWLVSAIALALLLVLVLDIVLRAAQGGGVRRGVFPWFFPLAGLAAFVLCLPIAKPLYEAVGVYRQVQLPWRVLSLMTLFASLSIGAIVETALGDEKRWRIPAVAALALSLAATGWLSVSVVRNFQPFPFSYARSFPGWDMRPSQSFDEMRLSFGVYHGSNDWLMEGDRMRPRWSVGHSPGGMFDVTFPPALGAPGVLAAFADGEGSVRVTEWRPQERAMEAESESGGTLVVRTFYYPSWHAYSDGKGIEAYPEEGSGVIAIALPPGRHEVALRFEASRAVRIGERISLAAAALALALAAFMRARKHGGGPDGVH